MEQLIELSADLTGAQARASGEDLRALTTQRRALESALLGRARALGQEAGVSMSPEMEREVQETLAAALAQPEAADQVRTGRLVKPIEYAGFGSVTTAAPAPRRDAEKSTGRAPTPIRGKDPEEDKKERARQRARERVEAARATAIEAGATAQAAKRELDQRVRAVEETRQQLEDVTTELERLRKRERDLEDELSKHERASRDATREHEQAQKEHAVAVTELEEAERELKG